LSYKFDHIAGFKNCKGGENCLGTDGVLRVSLGCFVSFLDSVVITTLYDFLSH